LIPAVIDTPGCSLKLVMSTEAARAAPAGNAIAIRTMRNAPINFLVPLRMIAEA
jgi:hypothetical protein